jgi:DNA-directed RNA polymerase specialized sigma24 family protein
MQNFGDAPMSDHIVRSYDKELEVLGRKIAEMGGIGEKMLSDAMDALANYDVDLALATVATDQRLDILQREIEDQAIMTIARDCCCNPGFGRSRAGRRSGEEYCQAGDETRP